MRTHSAVFTVIAFATFLATCLSAMGAERPRVTVVGRNAPAPSTNALPEPAKSDLDKLLKVLPSLYWYASDACLRETSKAGSHPQKYDEFVKANRATLEEIITVDVRGRIGYKARVRLHDPNAPEEYWKFEFWHRTGTWEAGSAHKYFGTNRAFDLFEADIFMGSMKPYLKAGLDALWQGKDFKTVFPQPVVATPAKQYGMTGEELRKAVWDNKVDVIKALMQKHPEAATGLKLVDWGDTLLHEAARTGNLEILQLAVDAGGDVNVTNDHGHTPLLGAMGGSVSKAAEWLLRHGANPNLPNSDGQTPFYAAINKGDTNMVNLLLQHGADVTMVSKTGWTMLHAAAYRGSAPLVELMLSKGLDVNATNTTGYTALHWAVREHHKEVVRLLLSKGADPNICCNRGYAVLDFAGDSLKGCPDPEVIRWLREHGAKIGRSENLWGAAVSGDLKLVEEYVTEHPDVIRATTTFSREILLHRATAGGDKATIKFLLDKGSDPNAADTKGWTPLHIAARGGDPEVVHLLLTKNADVTLKTRKGETALAIALQYEKQEAARVLKENGAK